jgi:DNA repair photolyase
MPNVKSVPAKNFMTRTGLADLACNPYVGCTHGCLYCYARFVGEYANRPEPWGSYVDVKEYQNYDIPKNTGSKSLMFSSVTDAYQPIEKTVKNTRKVLENTFESALRFQFLTKSALIVRDLDLFKQMQSVQIGFSIALGDADSAIVEPGASLPSERIQALKTLHDAGIRTWVFIAPILPYVTDVFAIIDLVKDDAEYILLDWLNLKDPENRANIDKFILRYHPGLLPRYRTIFEDLDFSYYRELAEKVRAYGILHHLDLRIVFPEKRP